MAKALSLMLNAVRYAKSPSERELLKAHFPVFLPDIRQKAPMREAYGVSEFQFGSNVGFAGR